METIKTLPRLKVMLLSFVLAALFSDCLLAGETKNSDPNQSSKYLDAVRTFADNVLKYGRDTYGPKHTPLFVDGLMVRDPNNPDYGKDGVYKPVEWIASNGERWVLCNLASQQNLFRTLDGLSTITGEPKYKQAAMDAIEYAFEHLRSPNGLLYWGQSCAYDAQGDKVCGASAHCFKANYPYYELMWEVNPELTVQFIDSLWASHILDWSNLDLDRLAPLDELSVPKGWDHEYKGGPVPFESKLTWGVSFSTTASDLYYAAAMLFKFSDQEKPLTWAKRLAHRYIETRDPETGISSLTFTVPKNAPKHPLANEFQGHVVHNGTFLFYPAGGDPLVHPVVNRCVLHDFICSPGVYSDPYFCWWICQFMLSEMLGEDGKEFQQWALEELSAWGKIAYRKRTNSWIPMLTDGTNLEGYVLRRDTNLGIKGTIFRGYQAGITDFWAYAIAYKVTGDKFMWQMARNIAIGNSFGDIGSEFQEDPQLRVGTDCSHPHAILGFLSLYESTGEKAFLEMAKKIGDNILAKRFHKGFFVPTEKHIYAKFDAIESFILLHLYTALNPDYPSLLPVWPTRIRFSGGAYRDKDLAFDNTLIYTLTESLVPPISLNEAAAKGGLNLAKSLIAEGADVDYREDSTFKTPLMRAVLSGHEQMVELLIANGADINAGKASPLYYAVLYGHKEIAEILITNGADWNTELLDLAVTNNHKDIVELFITKGADVTLHAAVFIGDLAKVKSLIEEGADIDTKDAAGNTPLCYAVREGNKELAEFLIANSADVNAESTAGETPLRLAIGAGHKDIIDLLLASGADINVKNSDGETPLNLAVRWGRKEIVELLLAKGADITFHAAAYLGDLTSVQRFVSNGADVNIKDVIKRTPLHYAVARGHKDIAEFLLSNGADINARDFKGQTPLDIAMNQRRKDIVDLLIAKGATVPSIHVAARVGDVAGVKAFLGQDTDVNAKDNQGMTPLHLAAQGGQREVVEFLLSKDADLNAKNNDGRTPIEVAMSQRGNDVVKLLIEKGADIPTIHLAAFVGSLEKLRSFIKAGTDINSKDENGQTPLLRALMGRHIDVVEFLIDNEADINTGDKWGYMPLVYALWNMDSDMVKLLLDKGADANAKDTPSGYTSLHWAIMMGNKELTEMILDAGADVNVKAKAGATPLDVAAYGVSAAIGELLVAKGAEVSSLHAAAYVGDLAKVKAFIDEGVEINKKAMVSTALHSAATGGHREIVEFLIDKGTDVDAQTGRGQTPLHMAAQAGHLDVVQLLLDRGAKVNVKNKGGQTPLQLAEKQKHSEIAELLKKLGAEEVKEYDRELDESLLQAISEGDIDEVKSLISEGANIYTRQWGGTTLHIAAQVGHKQIVELLIATGANVDAKDVADNTPMHCAASGGHRDVVELLFVKGANINAMQAQGWTPLHEAVRWGHKNVTELLINKEANVNVKDRDGRTPLWYAKASGNTEMVELFPEQGPPNDVAITNISVPSSSTQEDRISVVVNIVNQSDYSETLAVTLSDVTNSTTIGTESVHLSPADIDGMDETCDVIFPSPTIGLGRFGQFIDCGGDVNGDGYNDILISAPWWNNEKGRVYLYYGGPDMDANPDKIFEGENSYNRFGIGICLGDVNGDNYEDVLVGAVWYNNLQGRVYIFHGGPNMDLKCDLIIDGEAGTTGRFGYLIDVGDVDNDNCNDLLITAPISDTQPWKGRAYLYYGGEPMDTNCDVVFEGENEGDSFGIDAVIGGDIDSDGYKDILIGAVFYPNSSPEQGRAYLYYGNDKANMDTSCDVVFDCPESGRSQFSYVEVFDIDADGYSDVIIGARFALNCRGRVYLYWGDQRADMDAIPDKVFTGEETGMMLGGNDIQCGYFNNDDYADIAVAAYMWYRSNHTGRVYIYYGGTKTLMDENADKIFTGVLYSDFGKWFSISDLNNDNYGDIVSGGLMYNNNQGRAWLYYGSPGDSTQLKFDWDTSKASVGTHILKADIAPIAGEKDTEDNTMTITVDVTEPTQ
jgi:ankyrin repeat protein